MENFEPTAINAMIAFAALETIQLMK